MTDSPKPTRPIEFERDGKRYAVYFSETGGPGGAVRYTWPATVADLAVAGFATLAQLGAERTPCAECGQPITDWFNRYGLAWPHATGLNFCRKDCARDWQDKHLPSNVEAARKTTELKPPITTSAAAIEECRTLLDKMPPGSVRQALGYLCAAIELGQEELERTK